MTLKLVSYFPSFFKTFSQSLCCPDIFEELVFLTVPLLFSLDHAYSCKILLVQQFEYLDSFASVICERISYANLCLPSTATAGLHSLDYFLSQFSIKYALAQDLGLIHFLLDRRRRHSVYNDIIIKEVGLPFMDFPIYPELNIDWIIASPTTFSFNSEREKHFFLNHVLSFVKHLPSSDVVLYKPHNGHHRDYFAPRTYYILASFLGHIPCIYFILSLLSKYLPLFVSRYIDKLITSILHSRLIRLVTPLSDLTPFHHMPIEPFTFR